MSFGEKRELYFGKKKQRRGNERLIFKKALGKKDVSRGNADHIRTWALRQCGH